MAPPEFLCAELPWYNAMTHQTGSQSSVHALSCAMPRSWLPAQYGPVSLELPEQAESHLGTLCTASLSPAGGIILACFKLFIWNHCRLVLNFLLSLSFTLVFGQKDLSDWEPHPNLPLHTWSNDNCSSCMLKASDPFYPILTECFCRVFMTDCWKAAENTPPVSVKGELNPTL